MKQYPLGKQNKLCSQTAIEALFGGGATASISYPLRAVWRESNRPEGMDSTPKFMISIPKKRVRHAVDRVTMRRRVREAYRLHHRQAEAESGELKALDIAFVYIADELKPYQAVEKAMKRLLGDIYNKSKTEDIPEKNNDEPAV